MSGPEEQVEAHGRYIEQGLLGNDFTIMKLGTEEKQADVPAISTGSLGLDIALGVGGLPRGRVIAVGPDGPFGGPGETEAAGEKVLPDPGGAYDLRDAAGRVKGLCAGWNRFVKRL